MTRPNLPQAQTKATSISSNTSPPQLDWIFIKEQFAKGCPDKEFQLLMEKCRAMGLNPLANDVYFVSNWTWDADERRNVKRWSLRVSIDAMRKRAQESEDHQATKRQVSDDGTQANVKVWKKGAEIPFEETVYLEEFIQKKKDGSPNKMWTQMPKQMLKKCCEATVLRMAWPEKFSGLYINEEMPESDAPPPPDPKQEVKPVPTGAIGRNVKVEDASVADFKTEPTKNAFSDEDLEPEVTSALPADDMMTQHQRKQIYAMLTEMLDHAGIKPESKRVQAFIRHIFNVDSSTKVSAVEADKALMAWHGRTKDRELTDNLAAKWLGWEEKNDKAN